MIWHLIDSRTVGGAERHIALLVRALRARGIPAQAVLYSDYGINPWLSQLNAEDLPVRGVGRLFLAASVGAPQRPSQSAACPRL